MEDFDKFSTALKNSTFTEENAGPLFVELTDTWDFLKKKKRTSSKCNEDARKRSIQTNSSICLELFIEWNGYESTN